MNKIKIDTFDNSHITNVPFSVLNSCSSQKILLLFIIINTILSLYLFIEIKNHYSLIQKLQDKCIQNKISREYNKVFENQNNTQIPIDKDMIGLKYPEIKFDQYKNQIFKDELISVFHNFLTELEVKLIYLEKEINVTKLHAFYTTRTLYLQKRNVYYDDSRINKFHEIVSWLVIHKSTQLKGIASDKYLACKYVKLKTGKNLCPHRIGIYNSIEEIDFKNIIKIKNVVLKVSNGCHDNIYITKKTKINNLKNIKKSLSFHFNRDYSLIIPEFFHSFSKKRLILEKIFYPINDLYEFRFMVINHDIKLCIISYFRRGKSLALYLDKNYNLLQSNGKEDLSLKIFKKDNLDELRFLAIKLSEDFPNFIRVDLYLFHNNIYLSELTFDSNSGMPAFTNIKYFNDEVKKWKRIDY